MWSSLASRSSLLAMRVGRDSLFLKVDEEVLRLPHVPELLTFLRGGRPDEMTRRWWTGFARCYDLVRLGLRERRRWLHRHTALFERCVADLAKYAGIPRDQITALGRSSVRTESAVRLLLGSRNALLAYRRRGTCWSCVHRRLRSTWSWPALAPLPLQQRFGVPRPRPARETREPALAAVRTAWTIASESPYDAVLVCVSEDDVTTEALLPCPDCSCHAAAPTAYTPELLVGPHAGLVQGVLIEPTPTGGFAARTLSRTNPLTIGSQRTPVGGSAVREDPDLARRIALTEAAERIAGATVPVGLRRARPADVDDLAVSPHDLCLLTSAPDVMLAPLAWTSGCRMSDGAVGMVPAGAVYTPYPFDAEPRWIASITTGLAASSDPGDAALRALLEVIERDTWALAWETATPGRAIHPCCNDLAQRLARVARDSTVRLRLFDTRTDVAVVLAWSETNSPDYRVAFGLRASLSVHTAIDGALSELAQSQLHVDMLLRRMSIPATAARMNDHYIYYCRPGRSRTLAFLRTGEPHEPACDSADRTNPSDALGRIVRQLTDRGVEPWLVDVTTPDVRCAGISVVRVVAPRMLVVGYGGQRPVNMSQLLEARGYAGSPRVRPPRPGA